ncbi:MAG: beta-propeller fold lactonase family protein [Terracidiphilus sp.]|jgi:6-phosphogluconolactonase (cycloisomerase 2 family)
MKFTKFGKALLMSALSAALLLCVTSCVESYTVGYLYVTGTDTAQTSGNGIISGFSIDHNTGKLTPLRKLPVSSGGANPVRAVLVSSSRFLYVLNRGVTASGESDCTTADPCQNSNITLFAVGGDGILTQQEQFFTQGINPFRILADSSQNYIFVLDHDSPDNNNPSSTDGCALALGGVQTCGDITAFSINQSTGRLSLIENAQVTAAGGAPLTYFPVPVNPVDFIQSTGFFLTLSATPATTQSYPYTGGSIVFPYTFGGTGQLTINQNSSQPITDSSLPSGPGVPSGTAFSIGGSYLYVLDNEPIYLNGSTTATSQSQILPFTVGTNGALQSQTGGAVPDDPAQSNPIFLVMETRGKWIYVANLGNPSTPTLPLSGITGYTIDPTTHQLTEMPNLPFTTGAGPQCLVEDPSNQFFYTANFIDSTVSGNSLDQNDGALVPLAQNHNVPSNYTLAGPATWCLMDGRTN